MAERTIVKQVKNAVLYSDGTIRIDNVRLYYPHLHEPWAGNGTDDSGNEKKKKYSGRFGMPKKSHGEAKNLLKELMDKEIADRKWGGLAADRKFLRNGDDLGKPFMAGHYVISASEERLPSFRDRMKKKMTDTAKIRELFYFGSRVNVLIRPWAQDNKFGKRLNAGLAAVQFFENDERLEDGYIDDEAVDDTFDDYGDDGDGGFEGDDDDDL